MSLAETLTWPFFEDSHRRFASGAARAGPRRRLPSLPHDDVDEACRARVKALGAAGFLKAAVPGEYGGLHAKLDVRTLCIAREIARLSRRPRGLRVRHAGARHRLDLALRVAGTEAALSAERARRQGDRGLRALRTGGRLRRRRDGDDRDAGRQHPCAHRRREDLDFERRHRGPLRGVRAHRRSAGRARACRRSWSTPTRRASRSHERIEVIAPHPLATLKFDTVPRAGERTGSARRAKASRWRCRRSTSSARPSAPPRSASRAARCTRPWSMPRPASCSARRSATCR